MNKNHLAYLFLGSSPLVSIEKTRITESFLPEGINTSNFRSFDAFECTSEPFTEAQNLSMFSPKKMIVVYGLDRAQPDFWKHLLHYLTQPNPSVLMLFIGDKLANASGKPRLAPQKISSVKKMISTVGAMRDFTKEKTTSPSLIEGYVKQQRKKIQRPAIQKILHYQGDNQSILLAELDKLCSFVGDRDTITVADVEKVCLVVAEAKYWDLTQAILEQNVDSALHILDNLLQNEEPPHKLFAIIISQFRSIFEYQDAKKNNTTPPKMFPKNRSQIDRLLAKKNLPTYKLLRNFVHINTMFNSSKSNSILHLQQLVIKLSSIKN